MDVAIRRRLLTSEAAVQDDHSMRRFQARKVRRTGAVDGGAEAVACTKAHFSSSRNLTAAFPPSLALSFSSPASSKTSMCCWPFTEYEIEDPPKHRKTKMPRRTWWSDGWWSRGGRHWPGRYGWDWYDWRNDPRSREHYYFGRTADEVMDDYYAYAMGRHHGFSGRAPRRGDQDMVPRDPRDDQLFWCMELDGDWTLRSYNTIENALRPGYWTSYHGKAVFVRTRE